MTGSLEKKLCMPSLTYNLGQLLLMGVVLVAFEGAEWNAEIWAVPVSQGDALKPLNEFLKSQERKPMVTQNYLYPEEDQDEDR